MSIDKKTRELAAEIISTAEFNELKQARNIIEENRILKEQVREFDKMQIELYNTNSKQKETEEKLKTLNKRFENLSKYPEVNRYLRASRDFNHMVANVFKSINDFLEDAF